MVRKRLFHLDNREVNYRNMLYLVHTSHLQFVGFCVGSVGWILSAVTTGLIQWRVWYVADTSVITSGVAWVGIWKVCFYSRQLVTSGNEWMFCQSMNTWELFAPPEIYAAQVLMLAAVIAGVCGSASAVYGLRNIYFGIEEQKPIRTAFNLTGALYLSSGVCALVPLAWNIWSVAGNHAIAFPPSFHMPSTPVKQEVGEGIGVGIISSALMLASGVVFLLYRFPVYPSHGEHPFGPNKGEVCAPSNGSSFTGRYVSNSICDSESGHQVCGNPTF